MITLLRRLLAAFLYDQDWVSRWLAMGLGAAGTIITTGGNVPGTQVVVPGLDHVQFLGPWMTLGSLALVSITTSLPKDPPKP